MKIELTVEEVNLLIAALDSHAYWQVSEEDQRSNGAVIFEEEEENAGELAEIEALGNKLSAALADQRADQRRAELWVGTAIK